MVVDASKKAEKLAKKKRNQRFLEILDEHDQTLSGIFRVAISKGDVELARGAIAKGADVDATKEDGSTALHESSVLGNAELVELLLRSNARRDVKDKSGNSPLHCAAAMCHVVCMALLLAYCGKKAQKESAT